MKRATQVKTAKERAIIAIRHLKSGKDFTREFDHCFEMGDGDIVKLYLLRASKTDHVLRYCLKKAFAWEELMEVA